MSERQLPGRPFLSICITSYNRVDELYRCLKSVDSIHKDAIEIVVGEDCSPRKDEIAQIVQRFISETEYSVVFNANPKNLGYDRNFANLLQLAKGEYLVFITDDDAFCAGALDKVTDVLRETGCGVAFTPYLVSETGGLDRKFGNTMSIPQGLHSVKKFLYCSILLSGLIFKKRQIVRYSAEEFKNLIYSQVYVFCSLLLKNEGCYIDVPLVEYIGDGQNWFGLNDASEKNTLLANRKSIYSNLEYHKGLIRVIQIFDRENGTDLIRSFAREYSLKSYTGMYLACKEGKRELTTYWNKMNALNIELSIVAKIYYWVFKLFGYRGSEIIFQIPRKLLLVFRRRQVT